MLTQIINGHILTPQGWLKDGSVLISDGKILEVTNSDLAVIGATVIDAKGMYIVPGFISMHAHGGAGYDFTEGSTEAFQKASLAHLKHGATSIFPTLSSTSFENIKQAVKTCEALMKEPGSTIQGLHIEGPYLNKKMAGSQWEEFLKDPDPNEYIPLIESTQCIKRWDISPELPGGHEFGQYMRSKGIMAAITHTEAEYPEIKAAFESGFTHAAHFYNAMPGFHKRREYKYEGTVESVYLTDGMSVEVIADGIHLPATILKLVYKLKGVEQTCLVTDALKYAAYDGEPIDDPRYIIENGVCKLADHSSLVGSLATMDTLVRTMVKKAAIPLADAEHCFCIYTDDCLFVVGMNGVCQLDGTFHILFHLTDGISFLGCISQHVDLLATVIVLLHGGERDNHRGFRLSVDRHVTCSLVYAYYTVIDAIYLNELSARIVFLGKERFVDTLPDDAHLPAVAYVGFVQRTSHTDNRFFYLVVFRIKSFQGSRQRVFLAYDIYSPLCDGGSHHIDAWHRVAYAFHILIFHVPPPSLLKTLVGFRSLVCRHKAGIGGESLKLA